jgi:predicted cupin superfamily sugar epimerase
VLQCGLYAGAWSNEIATQARVLGNDIFGNQTPQVFIEKGRWQREWTLVGMTVAPGFEEGVYELPAPDFEQDEEVGVNMVPGRGSFTRYLRILMRSSCY